MKFQKLEEQLKGMAIVNLLQLGQGEKIAAVIPVHDYNDELFVLMATRNGLNKKTKLIQNAVLIYIKLGFQGITLKEDDELIDVRLQMEIQACMWLQRQGMSIRFKEEEVRAVGRTSRGLRV